MADYSRKTPEEVIAEKKEQDENDRRTPAYRNGFSDATHDRKFDPSHMDVRLYTLGYQSGESAAGKRPEESAVSLERVWPSYDPMHDAGRHGYEEARDMMPCDPRVTYSDDQKKAYLIGYRQGILEKIHEGDINVDKGREKLGYHPFEEPPTTTLSSVTTFDPPILFDPVKVPEHYNTGKIEVTNFITDQGLNFPKGNVVKYVARAGKKDPEKEIEDLEKAAAYLQMAHNLANGLPAIVRDPKTNEVVWSLFQNESEPDLLAFNAAVSKERMRQIEELGYSPDDDLKKGAEQLLEYAEAYFARGDTIKGTALVRAARDVIRKKTEGPYYPN